MRGSPCAWICIGLAACTSSAGPQDLIELDGWREAGAAEDPFADRPDEVECPTSSRVIELEEGVPYLEVDTTFCNYMTLVQETLVEVLSGDRVVFRWGHRELDAPSPAQAHVALLIGNSLIEDRTVDIPALEMDTVVEFEMSEDVPKGRPLWLHLHNHGDNQWLFYTPEVQPL